MRRRRRAGAPEPDAPASDAQQIRRLLGAREKSTAAQGVAMLEALGDPALWEPLLEGISIDPDGVLQLTRQARRKRHLYRDRRTWTALSLLGVSGRLAGVTRLWLDRQNRPSDLSPLAAAPDLEALTLESATDLADLSFLAHTPQLQSLTLRHCAQIHDLSPLSGAGALRRLKLHRTAPQVVDLSPLSGLGGLIELALVQVRLSNLWPLARLTNLQSLWLSEVGQITDYTPITGLRELRELGLFVNRRWLPGGLPPLIRGHAEVQRALARIGERPT